MKILFLDIDGVLNNKEYFRCGFIGNIIDKTPHLEDRAEEIKTWLASQETLVESFVILEDDLYLADLELHVVRTTFEQGLTDWHANRATMMLRNMLRNP